MSGVFHFKQFSVDQTGCAMKINTDGVLLGALAEADEPKSILDIGTGTGVIALMLAQQFTTAQIDAVEIDASAARTAERNFINSPFSDRFGLFPLSFEQYFQENPDKKYDLIISNPPFYINSLTSPKNGINLAKHADADFFDILIQLSAKHLAENGRLWLVLPLQTAGLVKQYAANNGLYPKEIISIRSFKTDDAHRQLICFGLENVQSKESSFIIYDSPGVYSENYKALLKSYFIAF